MLTFYNNLLAACLMQHPILRTKIDLKKQTLCESFNRAVAIVFFAFLCKELIYLESSDCQRV